MRFACKCAGAYLSLPCTQAMCCLTADPCRQVGALVTDHHQCSLRVKSILDACDDEGEALSGQHCNQ